MLSDALIIREIIIPVFGNGEATPRETLMQHVQKAKHNILYYSENTKSPLAFESYSYSIEEEYRN